MFPSRRITTSGGDKFRDEFSLAFDGSDDCVDCGAFTNFIADGATTATLGCWFKSADDGSGSGDYGTLIGERTGKNLLLGRSSSYQNLSFIYAETNGGNENECKTSGTNYFDQQWHFAVGTYSSGVAKIYVDGILKDTQDNSGVDTTLDCDSASLTIGASSVDEGSDREFYGNISDAFVYTSALSANDIKTIYNSREPFNHNDWKNTNTLKAWYRMGDGTFDQKATTDSDGGIVCDMTDATLGSDLLGGRGNFTDNSDDFWTFANAGGGDNIEITGGVCEFKASGATNGALLKTGLLTVGKMYKLDVDVLTNSGGGQRLLVDDGNPYIQISTNVDETGSYTIFFYVTNNTTFRLYRWDNTGDAYDQNMNVDNLVIREVTGGNHGHMVNMNPNDFQGDTP